MRHFYIECHHLLHQYLSLNQLSPTTRSIKEKKYKVKEKENPNLQQKERKPILFSICLRFGSL